MTRHGLFLLLFVASVYWCQSQTAHLGIWEGKMNAGVELRMIFHFSQDASQNPVASFHCPDQGIKDIKADNFTLKGDSVYLEISKFRAKYAGKFVNDSVIAGIFNQGMSFPLDFKKVNKITEMKRPQTPVAPFPYQSEDIIYHNKNKSISYGATITIPKGNGPFPAVLLLTGSGQQNRDEETMGHKPFAVIADHLTLNGIIVLRVDDRGMGKTTGDLMSATSRDFADDAIVSFEYLKSRREVDKSRMGLIGHSEGGMIAQIIAAERKDIDFLIMLAGPGENVLKGMNDQNEAVLRKSGMPENYVAAYLVLYNQILRTILSSDTVSQKDNVRLVVDKWVAANPAGIVVATTGIKDENSKSDFVDQFINQVGRPWFRYFLSYYPSINLKKINAKVLALNGSNDIQVISKTNLAAIEQALKEGKSKSYEVKELEGLNHLFQECKTCTLNEYNQIEQTISPVVLNIITGWLKRSLNVQR